MNAPAAETIDLGSITCPSGRLVIVDAGYLGLWSGAEPPVADEDLLLGIDDPAMRESIAGAVDLAVAGPDAWAAADSFGHQQGMWLYDIPRHGVEELTQKFADHCRAHGLDARLEPTEGRVPHRLRAERCVPGGGGAAGGGAAGGGAAGGDAAGGDAGGGQFVMHGVPVVAVGVLPVDRLIPVTATVRDFGEPFGLMWETVTLHVADRATCSPGHKSVASIADRTAPALVGEEVENVSSSRGETGPSVDGETGPSVDGETGPSVDGETGPSVDGGSGLYSGGGSGELIGWVGVDAARLILADADGLAAWRQDDPIDGLADVAFWGRSQAEAAAEFGAPLLGTRGENGVHGWTDLDVRDAVERAIALEDWRDARPERRLAVDFRPHSHHWQVMARVRASEHNTGHIQVGGADMLCFMTGWGDGLFPVYVDRDSDGRLLRIRITLGDVDDQ